MASLYPRPRSPYWWIKYLDDSGETRRKSTKYRRDVTAQSRKAHELRDELTTRELATTMPRRDGAETWDAWVPRFIRQRYTNSALTLIRYQAAWHNVYAFLRKREILAPRQLSRQDVRDLVEFRQVQSDEFGKATGTKRVKKNTAMLEVSFLGVVMDEAVESGFCAANPCLKLGFKRSKQKKKPLIEIEQHRLIIRSSKREPLWIRDGYRIAYWQGCRLTETRTELALVDLERNVFGTRTKGEKDSIAEFPLSPKLRPLMRRLKAEGRKFTVEFPRSPAKQFINFFRRIGLENVSIHCTRNTFITRCKERGIPREDVMRLAGHTSTAAHEIYPRVSASGHYLQDLARKSAA